VFVIDLFLVVYAFLISYLIRFNFTFQFGDHKFFQQIPLIVVLAAISFLIFGSYKGIVRHTGMRDAENVAKAISVMTVILLLIVYASRKFEIFKYWNVPLSVVGMNLFVSIVLLIGSRMVYKSFYYRLAYHFEEPKRVMIYGAHTGIQTYDALKNDTENKYDILGFIDERPEYVNKMIHRIKVFHPDKITEKFIVDKDVEEIIISKPEATPIELLEIADNYTKHGVKVKTVPHINRWINGELNVGQIKELNIEELLNRVPIKIDNADIEKDIKNKVVLITGAAGSIGAEISSQVIYFKPKQLVMIDQAESALYDLQQDFYRKGYADNFISVVADVRSKERMDFLMKKYRPEVIFHAAAYKHVPLMEENPYEAVKVNVLGSKNMMDLAVKYDVSKFVMISTDKAVNPTNVMGATKRVAEMYSTCQQQKTDKTKFIVTRFGNVLGSNGSVIPLFRKQIKQGGPLTVTHKNITRFFMTIPEACQLVLEAGVMGKGGEIFVFDMGAPVKIFDLAIKMIQLSGLRYQKDIDIKITGLRPGEKLYEEVLGSDEGDLPTHHPKIKIAQLGEVFCENICQKVGDLYAYDSLTDMEIVEIIKQIVPEFKSNNSVYSKLDS